jgi:hypothetical protein
MQGINQLGRLTAGPRSLAELVFTCSSKMQVSSNVNPPPDILETWNNGNDTRTPSYSI